MSPWNPGACGGRVVWIGFFLLLLFHWFFGWFVCLFFKSTHVTENGEIMRQGVGT